LDAAAAVAHDPHPAVRWSTAYWLGLARHAAEERVWALVEEIARGEPSASVLQALLRPIAAFANTRSERALALAREIYEREAQGERREVLLRSAASLLVEFWVFRGREEGRALVDRWIADIADAAELARSAFFRLRAPVTRGGDSVDEMALRERAIGFLPTSPAPPATNSTP
jgi:hypothetical protein